MNIYEEFVDNLNKGDFQNAKNQIDSLDFDKCREQIIKTAYDTESIVVYSFVCYLLETTSEIKYHDIAIELMIHVFQYIEGAYSSALYHLRKLINFEPNNIGYLEMLLFFWSIPEKLVSDEEALLISKRIVEYDSENSIALKTISRINHS